MLPLGAGPLQALPPGPGCEGVACSSQPALPLLLGPCGRVSSLKTMAAIVAEGRSKVATCGEEMLSSQAPLAVSQPAIPLLGPSSVSSAGPAASFLLKAVALGSCWVPGTPCPLLSLARQCLGLACSQGSEQRRARPGAVGWARAWRGQKLCLLGLRCEEGMSWGVGSPTGPRREVCSCWGPRQARCPLLSTAPPPTAPTSGPACLWSRLLGLQVCLGSPWVLGQSPKQSESSHLFFCHPTPSPNSLLPRLAGREPRLDYLGESWGLPASDLTPALGSALVWA